MIRSLISVALGAVMAFTGSAMAQDIENPTQILPSVSFKDIGPALQSVGAKTKMEQIDGEQVMVVEFNGSYTVMRQRACSASGKCAGLWMFALMTDRADLNRINAFNNGSKPARALALQDGTLVLDRYLIADYGVTKGSFLVNFAAFNGMIGEWFTFNSNRLASTKVSFNAPEKAYIPNAEISHENKEFLQSLANDGQFRNGALLLNAPTGRR